ncbi:MAG: HAMP domain-containing protein [Syntrophobacterales bacterium]|nr:MAG: HAMP domain-containing protein [Syntrophobacterales bacterium]
MAGTRRKGISLLTKLTIGILIPLVMSFIVIGYIYILQIEDIKSIATKEGVRSLNDLGEKMIKQKALDVAKQIEIFIKSHPHFSKGELYNSPALKAIAVQKVGRTGYTTVHDKKAISHFDKNPKIVGRNLLILTEKLPEFRSILEASLKKRAYGYYNWRDADGVINRKYMFCTPVDGADLVVAATTYIDEFSKPASQIEQRIMAKAERTRILFLIVMGVSLIVVILVTSMYSRTIVKPIVYLTDIADRISLGDLDTKIEIRSSDEVGMLAESFNRMQESLKAAIERLRKKRSFA